MRRRLSTSTIPMASITVKDFTEEIFKFVRKLIKQFKEMIVTAIKTCKEMIVIIKKRMIELFAVNK